MITIKRGRPSKGASQLNAQAILDSAKTLMIIHGKPPSIRKLAESLNVDAMAIYHYYQNKAALLEAIAVSLIDDLYMPTKQIPWQEEVHALSLSYLTLLGKYAGLLETLLSMHSMSPAEVFFERFKRIIACLQLPEEVEKNALDLLVDYLHGYALALSCQGEHKPLDLSRLEGPLGLYCRSLQSYLSP